LADTWHRQRKTGTVVDVRPLKTTLILLFSFILLIGVLIGGMFASVAIATQGPMMSAEQFLDALNVDNGETAYLMTAPDLQEAQSKERFLRELAGLRQSQLQLAPWSRQTLPYRGITVLEAFNVNGSDTGTPVVLEMVDQDGWKVRTVTDWTSFDVGPGGWFRKVPVESEVRKLVEGTLVDLNEAVAIGDFGEFIDRAGELKDVARSSFVESFDRLVENGTDFSGITQIEAALKGPIDWQIVKRCAAFGGGCTIRVTTSIEVSGLYLLDPSPLRFTLFYTYSHPDWVLGCAPSVRECVVEFVDENQD
jgi:hypothetical protein